MTLIRSLIALVYAFYLTLTVKEIRKLCLRPWAIGLIVYLLCLIISILLYDNLTNSILNHLNPKNNLAGTDLNTWYQNIYANILSWTAALLSILILSLFSFITSFFLVIISNSLLQDSLVNTVIKQLNPSYQLPQLQEKFSLYKTLKFLLTELLRLTIISTLIIFSLALSLIPFFFPISLILSGWLLGIEFIDITLEHQKTSSMNRIKFPLKNFLSVTLFGLSILVLWSIPFLGFLLPPVVLVAATWLVSYCPKTPLLADLE